MVSYMTSGYHDSYWVLDGDKYYYRLRAGSTGLLAMIIISTMEFTGLDGLFMI
jgi:hypothetical protein